MAMMHHHPMGSGDRMTEDLNKQELTRIMSGNTSAPPAPASGSPAPGASAPPPPAK
jgi:hypothetical protein